MIINLHAGQKQLWESVKQNWSFVRQEIVEKFVNNCTICVTQKPSFHPLACKPIIARKYLSQVQIDLIDLSYDADVAAFLFDLFFFIGSPPAILQSDNGKEFCAAKEEMVFYNRN
ncbi:hypothetical protein C1645_876178 [Glomus cerebriforme]|uniref:Integrase zinc-binding domain-containing protein n=1 Tax=Glomus cerebriforme TaxID=658196 RepID=A0A397T257_9GLOM|nr:hypothetical protein C1645_876178 [Glomus cerebriforme]